MVVLAAARDPGPGRAQARVRSREREMARETAWPAARAQETGRRPAAARLDFSADLLRADRAVGLERAASRKNRCPSAKPKCIACCVCWRNLARLRKARGKRKISTRP